MTKRTKLILYIVFGVLAIVSGTIFGLAKTGKINISLFADSGLPTAGDSVTLEVEVEDKDGGNIGSGIEVTAYKGGDLVVSATTQNVTEDDTLKSIATLGGLEINTTYKIITETPHDPNGVSCSTEDNYRTGSLGKTYRKAVVLDCQTATVPPPLGTFSVTGTVGDSVTKNQLSGYQAVFTIPNQSVTIRAAVSPAGQYTISDIPILVEQAQVFYQVSFSKAGYQTKNEYLGDLCPSLAFDMGRDKIVNAETVYLEPKITIDPDSPTDPTKFVLVGNVIDSKTSEFVEGVEVEVSARNAGVGPWAAISTLEPQSAIPQLGDEYNYLVRNIYNIAQPQSEISNLKVEFSKEGYYADINKNGINDDQNLNIIIDKNEITNKNGVLMIAKDIYMRPITTTFDIIGLMRHEPSGTLADGKSIKFMCTIDKIDNLIKQTYSSSEEIVLDESYDDKPINFIIKNVSLMSEHKCFIKTESGSYDVTSSMISKSSRNDREYAYVDIEVMNKVVVVLDGFPEFNGISMRVNQSLFKKVRLQQEIDGEWKNVDMNNIRVEYCQSETLFDNSGCPQPKATFFGIPNGEYRAVVVDSDIVSEPDSLFDGTINLGLTLDYSLIADGFEEWQTNRLNKYVTVAHNYPDDDNPLDSRKRFWQNIADNIMQAKEANSDTTQLIFYIQENEGSAFAGSDFVIDPATDNEGNVIVPVDTSTFIKYFYEDPPQYEYARAYIYYLFAKYNAVPNEIATNPNFARYVTLLRRGLRSDQGVFSSIMNILSDNRSYNFVEDYNDPNEIFYLLFARYMSAQNVLKNQINNMKDEGQQNILKFEWQLLVENIYQKRSFDVDTFKPLNGKLGKTLYNYYQIKRGIWNRDSYNNLSFSQKISALSKSYISTYYNQWGGNLQSQIAKMNVVLDNLFARLGLNTGEVYGRIYMTSSDHPNVKIRLANTFVRIGPRVAITNKNGWYRIKNIPVGDQTVKVIKRLNPTQKLENFQPQSIRIRKNAGKLLNIYASSEDL